MRQFFAFLLAPLTFLFCMAAQPDSIPPDYLITEIRVTCPELSPSPLIFTDQQTMGDILQYLRTVPLQGQADTDSMSASRPLYAVRLIHATGRVTEYRQLGAEYLCKNGSPWYAIPPEDGCFPETLFRQVFPGPGR